MTVHIKENSWLARLAAWKLGSKKVALVFGRTVHLFNTTSEAFLQNEKWVRHEITHVKQYEQLGSLKFVLLYLVESIRKGYHDNKFEREARRKENDPSVMTGITIAAAIPLRQK